jgi:hypothetical protein
MAKNLKEVIGYVKKSQGNVIEKKLISKNAVAHLTSGCDYF